MKLLKDFLISKANTTVIDLKNDGGMSEYLVLLETVFCRTILLNRRRPGELQRLRVDTNEQLESANSKSGYEVFSEVV